MSIKSVLLIMPQIQGDYSVAFPPLGIAYLSEFLKKYGIHCECLDMRTGIPEKSLIDKIKNGKIDLIGFSMVTLYYKRVYRLIEKIRNIYEGIIVAGGPHVSTFREKVLSDCQAIDYGIVLDGEETLLELCNNISAKNIKSLIHRVGNKVIFNDERPLIKDLDTLPFPRFQGFDFNKYASRSIPLVTSRGCPGKCIFCCAGLTSGKKYRRASSESVISEIRYWYNKGFNDFFIVDDNFVTDRKRLKAICEGLQREKLDRIRIVCKGIRADQVDYEILQQMWKSGFREIQLGVESASDRILEILQKGETISSIENTVRNACDLGFDVALEFVVGTPGETFLDVKESLKFAMKYPVREVCFNSLIPYPYTVLYDLVKKKGRFIQPPEVYLNTFSSNYKVPVFDTPEFPFDERVKALKLCNAAGKKVRRNFLRRKMSKYPLIRTFWPILFSMDFIYLLFKRSVRLRKYALKIFDSLSRNRN